MNTSYRKLCTEFYDHTKPQAGQKEIEFYEIFLKKGKRPFLEAMCGSGRLLIPLLEKGYNIDGLDSSPEMLKSCSERCKARNLKVNLFDQSLNHLSLSCKYGLIFIAVGSFQLIEDRFEAQSILKKLHEHLLPEGILLIETFIPWDTIRDCIDGAMIKEQSVMPFEKKQILSEDAEIIHKGTTVVYPIKQLEVSDSQYEKLFHQKMIETENERLAVRWYYRYELELLLQKSGFSRVQVWDKSFELNPQAIIYEAIK